MNTKKTIVALAIAMAVAFVASVGMASADDTVVPLYANQTTDVGTVTVDTVRVGDTSITITYATTDGWVLNATHLHVADDLDDIPQTKKNNPIPGQFMCSEVHDPPVTGYPYCTCTIPAGVVAGDKLYIAAHAKVALLEEGVYVQEETAWAGTEEFEGKNWATYFEVTVEEAL